MARDTVIICKAALKTIGPNTDLDTERVIERRASGSIGGPHRG